jgi:hypothetical protein
MDFLEEWLEDALTSGSSRHEASNTFVGGPRGAAWIVRALIKLLANLGASIGKSDAPEAAPGDYELDRGASSASWVTSTRRSSCHVT